MTLYASDGETIVRMPHETSEELIGKLATQKLYTNVKAVSGRFGVNVFVGRQTFEFGRASGHEQTADHVKACAVAAVTAYSEGRFSTDKGWSILGGPAWRRGEYNYTIWAPK